MLGLPLFRSSLQCLLLIHGLGIGEEIPPLSSYPDSSCACRIRSLRLSLRKRVVLSGRAFHWVTKRVTCSLNVISAEYLCHELAHLFVQGADCFQSKVSSSVFQRAIPFLNFIIGRWVSGSMLVMRNALAHLLFLSHAVVASWLLKLSLLVLD